MTKTVLLRLFVILLMVSFGSVPAVSAGPFKDGGDFNATQSVTDLNLGLQVIGVTWGGAKAAFAIFLDEKTGNQGVYSEGSYIKGAMVRKISRDSVVIEKDGLRQIILVKNSGNRKSGVQAPNFAKGVPSGLNTRSLAVEPFKKRMGPQGKGELSSKTLPFFKPFSNTTGPVVKGGDKVGTTKLPEFTPVKHLKGLVIE